MGKKNKSKKRHDAFNEFFLEPASNPFEEEQEATVETQLRSDLFDSDTFNAELDFDSNELADMQSETVFPDWHCQAEQTTPAKELPATASPISTKPNHFWKGDGDAVYEYDVAMHLATHFNTGLYQGIPYIRTDGVDSVITSQMIGPLMLQSMPSKKIKKVSAGVFKHIQTWLQSILTTQGRVLQRDPTLVRFENGVFDLRNGRIIPESQLKYKFFPVMIHASYYPDQEPDTPVFNQFLDDCSGGDPAIRQLMLEFLGYMLAPCDPDTIILMGEKAGSGKSVLANLARELLGMDKTCAISLSNFGKSFEVSQIFGKVSNFCLDISGQILSDSTVATIKRLTGADPETINAKYKDPFPYTNYAKLVFACNEGGIRLRHPDSGIARRLVVIPFLYAVPKSQMDKMLRHKLWAERDGIVCHAMAALGKLYSRNYEFTYCKEGELVKRKYMGTEDTSVQDFIDDCCSLTPEEREWTSEMYEAYLSYCRDNGIYPVGRKRFSQMIYSIPGVHARKFQQNHIQLQGAQGISLIHYNPE